VLRKARIISGQSAIFQHVFSSRIDGSIEIALGKKVLLFSGLAKVYNAGVNEPAT
jgi:hypothetical protein